MNNIINVYERKGKHNDTQRFLHLRTLTHPRKDLPDNVVYSGKFVDEYFRSHDTTMSHRKMVSKGWKLVKDPVLNMQDRLLADVTHLNDMMSSGQHVIRIAEVASMLGEYALLLQESSNESMGRGK